MEREVIRKGIEMAQNGILRILTGGVIDQISTLPDESVHCCVTSPPYWGLRDYSTEGQIGLEKTPEEYVTKMVEVFREVRRVLRKDGTLWLNLGDSYAGGGNNSGNTKEISEKQGSNRGNRYEPKPVPAGLKPKDLVGIPWRVAFALQADGWWLRSDIIWAKPSPMPESVTDRPTKSHEYLFLFAKGDWRQRPIKFSDLPHEFVHFVNHRWEQMPTVGKIVVGGKCVQLATTILDCAQSQYDFCLPPFYNEVWEQSPDGSDSSFVSGLPMKHWSAVWANRFLASKCSTKRFLQKLQGLFMSHPTAYHLLESWVVSELSDSPHIYCNSDGSLTINDSGHICEFQIMQGQIITAKPSDCTYFYDAEAIREPHATTGEFVTADNHKGSWYGTGDRLVGGSQEGGKRGRQQGSFPRLLHPSGRNKRSVWTVATAPYPEAHFATYPPDLIKPCILAGTSAKGCCAKCGSPWERIVESQKSFQSGSGRAGNMPNGKQDLSASDTNSTPDIRLGPVVSTKTIGWQPTCECFPDYDERRFSDIYCLESCTVLDPFAGSGTTGEVALELGRKAILVELNPKYVELIKRRCDVTPGLALA